MRYHHAILPILLAVAATARADNKTLAEALFAEGRQLMEQGKTQEACAKLDASNKADPATGTQLNLASCYEKIGKTASAWALFTQVASSSKDMRAQFAQQRAAALAPTLSKLTVSVPNAPPGVTVRVDGAAMSAAAFGVAIPVDPGHHVVDGSATNKPRFHREIDVAPNAASATVVVTF